MIRGVEGLVGSGEAAKDRGAIARRLLGELWPHRGGLGLALGLILVAALAQAGGPWLVGRAIDGDIARRDLPGLLRTLAMLLGVYAAGALAQRAQTYQVGVIGHRVLAGIRHRLFEKFQELPIGFFDRRPLGDLMSRVGNDVDTLSQLLSQGLTQVLGSLLALGGVLTAMLLLSPPLALACFTVIPLMLLTLRLVALRARKAYRATRETTGAVMADLQEGLQGMRESQAFNRAEVNLERFRQRNASNRDANIQATAVTSALSPAIDVLSTLSTALVIGLGSWLVLHGRLTTGLLAAFLIYVQQFFRPIQLTAQVATQLQSAMAGAERIYAILDEEAEGEARLGAGGEARLGAGSPVPEGPAGAPGSAPDGAPDGVPDGAPPAPPSRPTPTSGLIAFEAVGFHYEAGKAILHDVSFTAEPGQTVALVGPTGAGKTTILNLIPRFYDANRGRVTVDGRDVRDLPRDQLRARMAIVAQEPFLFGGSLLENLRYGRPEATREEVEAAARTLGAHAFIAALPQGYDTPLGSGGAQLSQGQRQLLAMARAVIAARPILLLDEATSSLDARTEATTQEALATLLAGRTGLVIAHRLSTVRHAHAILFLAEGRIVERGTHEELLARGGRYAELHHMHGLHGVPSTP